MLIMRKRQCLLGLLLAHQASAFTGYTQILHRENALRSRRPAGPNNNNAFLGSIRMSATVNSPRTNTDTDANANTDSNTAGSSNADTAPGVSNTEIKSLNGSIQKEKRKIKKPHKQTKLENRKGKRRNNNPAMEDIAFLRKRTSELLRVTSKEPSNPKTSVPLSATSTDTIGGALDVNANNDIANNAVANNAIDAPLSRGMKVGRKTFNFLIDAWAFSGEMDAADQALDLLARMEELSDNYKAISPDVRSYTKVINALSRSMRADAGEIAENILDKMVRLSSSGANSSAKPNTFTYTAVIEAYANSGAQGSAMKAEEICEAMIEKYESGDPDVRPTARCFNAVINANTKSGNPNGAQQAEYIFDRMEGLYLSGVHEARPNTFNYNSLISAWANCEQEGSAERAEDVLARLEQSYKNGVADCKPTTATFNAVIDAYAKSGEDGSAQHAEQVLYRMEDLATKSGEDVKPNTRSFNSVMNAWAKSREEGAEVKAQDLLDMMTKLYALGNKTVRPDVHSFVTVINGTYERRKQSNLDLTIYCSFHLVFCRDLIQLHLSRLVSFYSLSCATTLQLGLEVPKTAKPNAPNTSFEK
jgi:hypothetical protein